MGVLDNAEEFGNAVRAARAWKRIPNKKDFVALLTGDEGSETTGDRWERGDLGKKKANPLARRQFAELIIEKTGCPRGLFELSEPAKDRELGDRLDLLAEAIERLAAQAMERDELETFRQWWTSDPRYGEQGPGAESG